MLRKLRRFTVSSFVVAAIAVASLSIAGPLLPEDAEHLRELATAHECMSTIGIAKFLGLPAILLAMQSLPCAETLANGGLQGYALVQCVLRYPVEICLGLN